MEQSYLRFSLEESIWFKKGQEVAEFLSISLDPIVSVDEYEQYITIRGALELSGEYRMAEGEESSADPFDFASHRFVQHISTREDGISELSHRFPIDITIPKNRIQHLEDVYVTVESFDYDLDENGRLLVTADISISGISEAPLDEPYEPSLVEEEDEDLLFEPFEVVARKEVYEEEQRKQQSEEETSSIFNHALQEQNEDEAQEMTAIHREETKQEEETAVPLNNNEQLEETVERLEKTKEKAAQLEKPEEKEEKSAQLEKLEEKEEKSAQLETPEETAAQLEEKEAVKAEEENVAPQQEAKVSIGSMKEKDADEMKEEIDENEKQKVKSENALYLTKLFAKNQEEEFTKVKICIVQQGDSLDKIADRYDITVQQLLRVNQLESPEEIHEGQLLYIPALAGSRSS
ncbi:MULTISPECIES: stage VI sporulation protein D [unclassified Geobacillus]|uniref:stage VI sporulation protein D n=1 Tax=unclassified Geobacillus TaxID=2642459 RepID=UPI000BE3E584|nr:MULTISPECIES: stage VI sporulation protein D [unclassified Geobacillus]PDM41511.1 stage VI sporulation protein D [Parageobacillus yumthangensis]RDV23582.1 stage VI sporulation protein D [Parageobacillus toebii]TXK92278.1 stage VI sporulation protein D [Parageobacillus sp. SY1]PUF89980.1 stage VI sporulation protein D [Geobacillus sp. LYN3]TXK88396.1 stage VI sporulation protein D [Geobacillus sp. AYS3]